LILTPCIVEEAVFNVGVEGGAAEESNAHCYLLLLGQVQGRRGRGVRLVLLCSLYYLLGLIYFFMKKLAKSAPPLRFNIHVPSSRNVLLLDLREYSQRHHSP
jgi:hypothetical protein